MSQLQRVQEKRAQSEQITTISTKMQIVWTNYNYFIWNAYCLSQLQGFQLNRAQSEPIATI